MNEAASSTGVVVLEGVGRVYDGPTPTRALHPTDLTVRAGDYLAVTGPSGSGKSTLLNLIGLLDTPSEGRYLLAGSDVSQLRDRDRTAVRGQMIGFVFQAFHLLGYRSAVDNVELASLYRHQPHRQRRHTAIAALDRVGLGHRLWATPTTLSGGERQRVAIARAIVNHPQVLLCDEPTGNLDSTTTNSVLDLLDDLHTHDGLTIIVITHDPHVAARAQRRVTITDGHLTEPDQAVGAVS